MDHNLIGSHVNVLGTGESQRNHTCKYHKDVPYGSQLRVGSFVCFHKTRFAWHDRKDKDVLEVFVVKQGIQRCKVGYLPKHLVARANRSNGLCTRVVKIYSRDPVTCDNVAKRQKFHRNVGCCLEMILGMRDMVAM